MPGGRGPVHAGLPPAYLCSTVLHHGETGARCVVSSLPCLWCLHSCATCFAPISVVHSLGAAVPAKKSTVPAGTRGHASGALGAGHPVSASLQSTDEWRYPGLARSEQSMKAADGGQQSATTERLPAVQVRASRWASILESPSG